MRLQTSQAIGLHVISKNWIEQQWHVTEQVVKDVWLDHIIKFCGGSNPVGYWEFAICEECKKRNFRDQAGHCHNLPASGTTQLFVDLIKPRNFDTFPKKWQRCNESIASKPW